MAGKNQLKDKMEERKRRRNTQIPKYFRETWSRKVEGIEERVSELTARNSQLYQDQQGTKIRCSESNQQGSDALKIEKIE